MFDFAIKTMNIKTHIIEKKNLIIEIVEQPVYHWIVKIAAC